MAVFRFRPRANNWIGSSEERYSDAEVSTSTGNGVETHARDGNLIIPAWDIHAKGADGVAALLPRGRNVYVTFDIDAFDPGIAPGTGTPEVGGLTFEQGRRLLELVLSENRIVGFDLVEVTPSLDPSQITALLGVQVMLEAVGMLFKR